MPSRGTLPRIIREDSILCSLCCLRYRHPLRSQIAPFASSCAEDATIPAPTREAVDAAAQQFIETLFGSRPTAAFDALSTEGRRATTRDEVVALANAVIQQFFTDPQRARVGDPKAVPIQKTYFLTL